MTEPDDRPADTDRDSAEHREPGTEHPQQDSESRLDHVDPDSQITPDEVKREQGSD